MPWVHQCEFCLRKFRSKSVLQTHMNIMHLNIKNFKCDQCDFATGRKGTLNSHKVSVHDGVMHPCDYPMCTKSYNFKGNLYAHRFRVHKIPRPKDNDKN